MKNWRNSRAYRIWRAKVIRRDKRCVVCGSIEHREAHHLNHASYFKDERFDVNNGITLCRNHHAMFHYLFVGGSRKKCTRKDFERFLKLIERIEYEKKNRLEKRHPRAYDV